MLVQGKSRFFSTAILLFLVFIVILTLSYNPSLPEDSAQYLKKWTKTGAGQAPMWFGQGPPNSNPQDTLPSIPQPQQDISKLPSANPDPFAAIGGASGNKDAHPPALPPAEKEKAPVIKPDEGPAAKPAEKPKEKPANDGLPMMGNPITVPLDFSTAAPVSAEVLKQYREVSSSITKDGKFYSINLTPYEAFNPNVIPHPRKNDTWIVVAQRLTLDRTFPSGWSDELACDAEFESGGNLTCVTPPQILPIAATQTKEGHCTGDLAALNLNIGPHDGRVFWGPKYPYTIYGSQSHYNCFGQWTQDFRMLVDWGVIRNSTYPFEVQTEIQRPAPLGDVEKNWFLFWDWNGVMYAHYDTSPKRAFAKLNMDGSAGEDLAPLARPADDLCWGKHLTLNPLPPISEAKSTIHQATNSLAVTFCKRADPACRASPENTFIIQIFQHKIGNGLMHARYEPFVMAFKQVAPFEMHAITSKPIWIRGRASKDAMLYATSISWKTNGTNYHGYFDDTMFINFGIEDRRMGAIDVLAGDLLADLMTCGG